MKKLFLLISMIMFFVKGFSQVGINTTAPDAQLHIKSSNQAAPANTDGILIPKIDAFPLVNPTAAQQGMMVYLTTLSAGKTPGFYYWDNTGTPQWKGFGGTIPNGTAVGNTMYWDGTTWVNNSAFLYNNGISIGVNTSTPSSILTVRQDAIGFTQENTSGNSRIGFYTNNGGAWLQTHSNTDLSFATNDGATQMILKKTTGNLGINTLTPSEKLEVVGKTKTTDLQVTNGAAAGSILTSDAVGNATWQAPAVLTGWSTTGNAATNPATHFIGTTDNVDFVFKRFSTTAGRISSLNTSLGVNSLLVGPIGTGNNAFGTAALQQASSGMNNNAVGNYALLNNHTGNYNNAFGHAALNANTTASNNVAIGNQALYLQGYSNGQTLYDSDNVAIGFKALYNNNPTSSTNAIKNVAIGSYALESNSTGLHNTAIGHTALRNNTIGIWNTGIGTQSLLNNDTGSYNTAVGQRSLNSNSNGDGNVALGVDALRNNISGDKNVALGFEAAMNETGSNKLYIENSNSSTPLIYGEFDNNLARINGELKINSTTITGDEMQLKNSNMYVHPTDTNINLGTGLGYFMISTQDSSTFVGNDTGGVYGDGNAVTIWSPGDANGGQSAALVYFVDEDAWNDNNGNPYDNNALKSYINTVGALVQISDQNKKENIFKIENALEKVSQINGYTYQFKLSSAEIEKEDKPIKSSGVLAQELEKVLPEAVQKNSNGDYFVDYAAITPLLIEALKEQNIKIKSLESLNTEILKRLEKLENK